jgi:hypothetical protein
MWFLFGQLIAIATCLLIRLIGHWACKQQEFVQFLIYKVIYFQEVFLYNLLLVFFMEGCLEIFISVQLNV